MKTLKQWLTLSQVSVRTTMDKHEAIAKLCFDTEAAGKTIGIWHASSIVHDKLDTCPCADCTRARIAG
jgi:hypothetical protein